MVNLGQLIAENGEKPDLNDANFRALLKYQIRGENSALRKHMETAKANAMYQSADIQNELILAVGNLATTTVIIRIKKARCWAIIVDETTDRQTTEQLAVVIRYVLPDEPGVWQCYEQPVLIIFTSNQVQNQRMTARFNSPQKRLAKHCYALDLDLSACVDQSYDRASSVASERVDAASTLHKDAPWPFASIVPCTA